MKKLEYTSSSDAGPAPGSVDGVILAGGESTRFGGDKVLHPVDGKPMLVRVHDALGSVVRRVWISVATPRSDLPIEAAQVVDRFPGAGPLAGLHAGLLATDAAQVLLVATDLPYLSSEVLRRLRDAPAAASAPVVSVTPDGRLQPLCARYPRTVLPLVEQHLQQGMLAMHALLDACSDTVLVEVDERTLRNVNRPSDY